MPYEGGNKDGKHYWLTPPDLMAELEREFGFDFDACPYPKPKTFDGLDADWGEVTYVNPPFGTVMHAGKKKGVTAWVRKAIAENRKGKTVVLVFPTDKWVHYLLNAGAELRSLGDVRWCATEDGKPGTGIGRFTMAFILRAKKVAALFVDKRGPYFGMPRVDPWPVERDARTYAGPYPVVAHPPCERWGRYWSGGPSARRRRMLGDDDGCFLAALKAVRKWGGVLEHPAHSHAFRLFGLGFPPPSGGWVRAADGDGWICHVEQGHYGHPARKATWLYAIAEDLPELKWGPSAGRRIEEGFHTNVERARARALQGSGH